MGFLSRHLSRTVTSAKMVKIYKPGRVVILLTGKHAGKKAIVVKSNDDGTQERPYEHALVTGIDRYPRKVTKSMSKKKVAKRSKLKPFVRIVNLKHVMPTRYTASDIAFDKANINKETLKDPAKRKRPEIWQRSSWKRGTRVGRIVGFSRN